MGKLRVTRKHIAYLCVSQSEGVEDEVSFTHPRWVTKRHRHYDVKRLPQKRGRTSKKEKVSVDAGSNGQSKGSREFRWRNLSDGLHEKGGDEPFEGEERRPVVHEEEEEACLQSGEISLKNSSC